MKRKTIKRIFLLFLAFLMLIPTALAGGSQEYWTVHITYDLNGGSWPDIYGLAPHALSAKVGSSMDVNGLEGEKLVQPYKAESVFMGWSVLFTDAKNGNIVYDGRGKIWDLNHPFDYYAKDPRVMNCLMIANWKPAESASSDSLSSELLPDGRVITYPFAVGTDPLPEVPPPAEQIIEGTTWLRNATITMIEDGELVPVFAYPAADGPVMDWVGLDEVLDYGMWLFEGWDMLYSPKWVENSGIGFIENRVMAYPGSEE